jgi:hypothetical protein
MTDREYNDFLDSLFDESTDLKLNKKQKAEPKRSLEEKIQKYPQDIQDIILNWYRATSHSHVAN